MSSVKCQKSNIKCQMPNVNKVRLLLERTSGASPVIFQMNAARHNVHMSEIKLSNILVITLIQYCGFVVFPLNIYSPEKKWIYHFPYFLFRENIHVLFFSIFFVPRQYCGFIFLFQGICCGFFNMLLSWENIVSL